MWGVVIYCTWILAGWVGQSFIWYELIVVIRVLGKVLINQSTETFLVFPNQCAL